MARDWGQTHQQMGLFSFLQPTRKTKHLLKPQQQSRNLIVPVDDSNHSLQALEWAVTNIYRADRADQLHLLSVVPSVAGPFPPEVRPPSPVCSNQLIATTHCCCRHSQANPLLCSNVQVPECEVPAAPSSSVKAWRSEQHAHDSETEALLSFMQHHAVNLGVSAGCLSSVLARIAAGYQWWQAGARACAGFTCWARWQ